MKYSSSVLLMLVVCVASMTSSHVHAQHEDLPWAIPPSTMDVNFVESRRAPRLVFGDESMFWEHEVRFWAFKHSQFTIRGTIPDGGSVRIVASDESQVEPIEATSADGKYSGVVKMKVRPLSFSMLQDLGIKKLDEELSPFQKRARELLKNVSRADAAKYIRAKGVEPPNDRKNFDDLYADERGREFFDDEVKRGIEDFAARHPEWVSSLSDRTPGERFETYRVLLTHELALDHLIRCGAPIEAETERFQDVIKTRVNAVYLLMSGGTLQNRDNMSYVWSQLTPSERANVTQRLAVDVRCRFIPDINKDDANSQWFNGQRIQCVGSVVGTVYVRGQLTPQAGDKADWWTLRDYDPQQVRVTLSKTEAANLEGPFADNRGEHHVRVAANGTEQVDYEIIIQPRSTGSGTKVDVHLQETSELGAKFPF